MRRGAKVWTFRSGEDSTKGLERLRSTCGGALVEDVASRIRRTDHTKFHASVVKLHREADLSKLRSASSSLAHALNGKHRHTQSLTQRGRGEHLFWILTQSPPPDFGLSD